MPDGWDPRHWLTIKMLRDGSSYLDCAEHFGVAIGTVSRWIRKARDVYGEDVVPARKTRRETQRFLKARQTADTAEQVKWAAVRDAAAIDNAETGAIARELARTIMLGIMGDERRLAEQTASDVTQLVRAADKMDARADKLSGIRDPDRAVGRIGARDGSEGPGVGSVPDGTLDGLDRPAEDEDEVLAMVEDIHTAYMREMGGPPGETVEVIDAESRKVG